MSSPASSAPLPVGEGIEVKSDNKHTDKYLQSWWFHPRNHLDRKCVGFCDEATRSGLLFFLCTADQNNGMLYVRAVPADQTEEIISAENDVEQELAYKPRKVRADGVRPPWLAYIGVRSIQTSDSPTSGDVGLRKKDFHLLG